MIEELQARAHQSGHPPDDESLALALVRDYGRPSEVAARYHPPQAIIAPADSSSFIRAAIIGSAALVLFAAVSTRLPSAAGTADTLVKIGIPFWLGLLVVAFGLKSWIHRRWPASAQWEYRDRDRANRIGTALVVPIATFFVVLYAAPAWVLHTISGGRLDTAWAAYTPDFQRLRLLCFIGLMFGLLVLLSSVAVQGRWHRLTRRLNIALNMALACLILSFAVEGNMFVSSQVDQIARKVLTLVALIYLPCVGVQLDTELGRLARPPAPKPA